MPDHIRIPEAVRISYAEYTSDGLLAASICDYLVEIFGEVFHKFEESESDLFKYDFIMLASEPLETLEEFVMLIIAEKFPGTKIKITPYNLQNGFFN